MGVDIDAISTTIVFLTFNDVYALFADDDGHGGIAKFATLLKIARTSYPADTRVIVTLNGDFLWRSELDRQDKGALMIELLNYIGVDYVVLGNHEFDFGEDTLQTLLQRAKFTTFGSNVRLCDTGALLQHTTDTHIVQLANGVKLGLFGVCTVGTATYSFATDNVAFESEVTHAKRCVDALQAQGADVVVALTHVSQSVDVLIAKQVAGIDAILGGHDHEPMSLFQGSTLIHKSGQDALWLGCVQLAITRPMDSCVDGSKARTRHTVTHSWRMLANRWYTPDAACAQILQAYTQRVEQECAQTGMNEMLAVSMTLLDSTRITCRSRESNVGNLIVDAMREELGADIAVVNGGCIRGERLFSAGLEITRSWLDAILPNPNTTCVIKMRVQDLRDAILHHWAAYPELNASFLQLSGVFAVHDIRDSADSPRSRRSLRIYLDAHHKHEFELEAYVNVATSSFVRAELPGFATGKDIVAEGPIVSDIVARFLQRHKCIAYPLQEGRIVHLEA